MKIIDINLVTEIRDEYDIISIVEKNNVHFLDDSFFPLPCFLFNSTLVHFIKK